MKIEDMIRLMEAVKKNGIDSFTYKNEAEKINIKKTSGKIKAAAASEPIALQERAVPEQEYKEEQADIASEKIVRSPLVGTFYAASSPGAQPFASVGERVQKGQVLGIIEAMKLMNEIESEYEGIIEAVLIEDESVVEFNQPLFRIR